MNLIDIAGLTDSDALPNHIFLKALRLRGYIIPPEERDGVLESLRLDPPTPDKGEPVTILTGPSGMVYWSAAPPAVRVHLVPGDEVLPQTARSTEILEWFLRRRGCTHADAKALCAKPPTERHGKWSIFQGALDDAIEWAREWSAYELEETLADTVSRWEFVGGERPSDRKSYEWVIVDNLKAYANLARELDEARTHDEVIGFDVETDQGEEDENNYEAQLVGAAFAFHAAQGAEVGRASPATGSRAALTPVVYYLPVNGPLDADLAYGLLQLHFWERTPPWWIAHGSKFDGQALAKAVRPEAPIEALRKIMARLAGDGVIAAYVKADADSSSGRPMPKGLKDLAGRYYNATWPSFKEMLGISGATKSSEAPLTDIGPYCCADAFWGVRVLGTVLHELRTVPKLFDLYEKLELPTVAVLAEMELLGLPLDATKLRDRRAKIEHQVEVLRRYLEECALDAGWQPPLAGTIIKGYTEKTVACPDHPRRKAEYTACPNCDERGRVTRPLPLNPNSTVQITSALRDTFGLPVMSTSDSGEPSYDEATLLKLREYTSNVDAKDWITFKLAWSKLNKVYGTYMVGMDERKRTDLWQPVHKGGSRIYIHPRFNQDVAVTGRLSSSDPNGQNLPLDQRDLFLIGWDADYSQLELRIFAFASKCRAMIQTFQEGGDIHATTCERIFGVAPKDQTPTLRVRAKTLNFGMAYGAQGETIQEQIIKVALRQPELHLALPSLQECNELVKKYWAAYPEAAEWVHFIKEVTRDRYWNETFYGRREYFPLIRSGIPELRARAERQAVNLAIQGTAGDLIKMAAVMLYEDAPKYGADIRAQVHDELLGCIWKPDMADAWLRVVEQYMLLDQPLWPVPLKVEPKLVADWKQAK